MFKLFAGLGILGVILNFLIWAGLGIGWILNIVKIVGAVAHNHVDMMTILRAIGVLVAPLGGILGWF
jgi:hypothetical protein